MTSKVLGRSLLAAVLLLASSGCAVYYHDEQTGADHVWGVGHLATKVTEPESDKQAVVRQVTLTGLALGLEEEALGFSLGWDRRERIHIYDKNTSISIQRPENGDCFLFQFGTEPFVTAPISNVSDKGVQP